MDKRLLQWLALIAALVFGFIWLLTATKVIGSSPAWMPPTALLCLGGAVLLSWL